MKIKTAIISAVASLAAISAFAQNNDEYIKAFGMLTYERSGLNELKFTPAEFEQFVQGMKTINDGGKLPDNISVIAPKMMEYLRARAEANIAKEAEKADAASADYWKKLEGKEGLNKTETGLAFEVVAAGDATKTPKEDSEVVVNYTGKLVDGTVFDSTKERGEPAQFNLSKVIPGFREGLQKIGKGGKAILYIPAKLGYANQPIPGIPVNSTLVFEVELVDVDPTPVAPAVPAQKK